MPTIPIQPSRFRPSGRFRRTAACGLAVFAACGLLAPPSRAQSEEAPPVPVVPVDRLDGSALPPVGGLGSGSVLTYRGDVDLRYRDANRETTGSYVAATRFTGDWTPPGRPNGTRTGGRVQLLLETDGQGTTVSHLRASEVYVFYDTTVLGLPTRFRIGQFALPFGLTAEYDPMQPIQPLYEKSLGLRVDTGILMEGEYGPYRYTGAITTGAGPNRSDFDANKVITFRLVRNVETELGNLQVGGSLLTGRGPVTSFDTFLPASGTSRIRRFVDKTRFAGDGEYQYRSLLLRGELVFGGDAEEPVWGYFAEGNYRATPRLNLVAFRRLWNFAEKPMSAATTGVGMTYDLGQGFTLRGLYEFQREVPLPAGTSPRIEKRFVLQTRLRF